VRKGRKKVRNEFLFPLMVIVGLVLSSWAIYQSSWSSPSVDWTSISRNVAGSIAYFFILAMILIGIVKIPKKAHKESAPLIILLMFTFLGIVSAGFISHLDVQNIVVPTWRAHYGYSLQEIQAGIVILCVFLGILFMAVKVKR